jgi:hypothetical protein
LSCLLDQTVQYCNWIHIYSRKSFSGRIRWTCLAHGVSMWPKDALLLGNKEIMMFCLMGHYSLLVYSLAYWSEQLCLFSCVHDLKTLSENARMIMNEYDESGKIFVLEEEWLRMCHRVMCTCNVFVIVSCVFENSLLFHDSFSYHTLIRVHHEPIPLHFESLFFFTFKKTSVFFFLFFIWWEKVVYSASNTVQNNRYILAFPLSIWCHMTGAMNISKVLIKN